jgi:hypothetical protein
MKNLRTLPGAALMLCALAFPTAAQADWTVFSGNECDEENDTTPDAYHSWLALNTEGGNRDFMCPIMRDSTQPPRAFYVSMLDDNPNDDVSCRLMAKNARGSVMELGAVRSSRDGVDERSLPIPRTWGWGQLVMRCNIAERNGGVFGSWWLSSGIQSYRILED